MFLTVPSELLPVTVCGREFQVTRAEQRNARLTNAVLTNGSDNRVVVARQSTIFLCLELVGSLLG